jgi:hypothetical protein
MGPDSRVMTSMFSRFSATAEATLASGEAGRLRPSIVGLLDPLAADQLHKHGFIQASVVVEPAPPSAPKFRLGSVGANRHPWPGSIGIRTRANNIVGLQLISTLWLLDKCTNA